jgi:hypothetical protein
MTLSSVIATYFYWSGVIATIDAAFAMTIMGQAKRRWKVLMLIVSVIIIGIDMTICVLGYYGRLPKGSDIVAVVPALYGVVTYSSFAIVGLVVRTANIILPFPLMVFCFTLLKLILQ